MQFLAHSMNYVKTAATCLALGTSLLSFAQHHHHHHPGRTCHTMENLEYREQQQPELKRQMQEIERITNQFIQSPQAHQRVNGVINIPVVVHVIYSNSNENISNAQIQSQLNVLNADFRRLNADANNKWSQAADTEIEFCLASVDPNGNATTGITRKSSSRTSWGTNDAMKSSSQGGVTAWPSSQYLNMWICNIGGGILGYAQFPGGSASTDGVVMSPQYFGSSDYGSNFYLSAPFDKGRTTTHEVGHWLNLRHIWGDGGCSVDDFVNDTPTSDAANYGCSTNHSSCGTADMVENYMDYSDDGCMNLFTQGQKTRMRALFASGGFRESLLSSNGCGGGNSGGGGNTGGTTCSSGQTEVNLSLTLDNYPSETSWSIVDANGATVASGSGYSTANSTVAKSVCLDAGCYDFIINDSYGDGICCSYGNGSYSLTDGSTVLASGGSFQSSEKTNFCVGNQPAEICYTLTLKTDNYPAETSWTFNDASGTAVATGSGYTDRNKTYTTEICAPSNQCFNFTINDSYGDGICCSYGNGFYSITDPNGTVVASGGNFGSSETTNICATGNKTASAYTQQLSVARMDMPNKWAINLFPNPVKGDLTVQLSNTKNAQARITTVTGQLLWAGQLDAGNNQIMTQELAPGMYIFTAVHENGKILNEKFIKE